MYIIDIYQLQSDTPVNKLIMKFSGKKSIMQSSNYIKDSLEYLSFHRNIVLIEEKGNSLIHNPKKDNVICLGERDDMQHLSNNTISFDEYQILSNIGKSNFDSVNLNKSINEIDITINIDNSFINIDDYEVLSEVGDDTIDLDMTEDEIPLINLSQNTTDLDTTDNNNFTFPKFQVLSANPSFRQSSPWDAAIDELLALGRKGLLEIAVPKSPPLQNNNNRGIQMCKFFIIGKCKYGRTGRVGGICKYKHIGSNIHNRIGFKKNKGNTHKGLFSPTHKGNIKRLQRNSLHQVKQWITSD